MAGKKAERGISFVGKRQDQEQPKTPKGTNIDECDTEMLNSIDIQKNGFDLVVGSVQSGKTKVLICHSEKIIRQGMISIIIVRNSIEDGIQLKNRIKKEKSNFISYKPAFIDKKLVNNKLINNVIIGLGNYVQLNNLKELINNNPDIMFSLCIDEVDVFAAGTEDNFKSGKILKEIFKQKNVYHILGVTATPMATILAIENLETPVKRVFKLEEPLDYVGIKSSKFKKEIVPPIKGGKKKTENDKERELVIIDKILNNCQYPWRKEKKFCVALILSTIRTKKGKSPDVDTQEDLLKKIIKRNNNRRDKWSGILFNQNNTQIFIYNEEKDQANVEPYDIFSIPKDLNLLKDFLNKKTLMGADKHPYHLTDLYIRGDDKPQGTCEAMIQKLRVLGRYQDDDNITLWTTKIIHDELEKCYDEIQLYTNHLVEATKQGRSLAKLKNWKKETSKIRQNLSNAPSIQTTRSRIEKDKWDIQLYTTLKSKNDIVYIKEMNGWCYVGEEFKQIDDDKKYFESSKFLTNNESEFTNITDMGKAAKTAEEIKSKIKGLCSIKGERKLHQITYLYEDENSIKHNKVDENNLIEEYNTFYKEINKHLEKKEPEYFKKIIDITNILGEIKDLKSYVFDKTKNDYYMKYKIKNTKLSQKKWDETRFKINYFKQIKGHIKQNYVLVNFNYPGTTDTNIKPGDFIWWQNLFGRVFVSVVGDNTSMCGDYRTIKYRNTSNNTSKNTSNNTSKNTSNNTSNNTPTPKPTPKPRPTPRPTPIPTPIPTPKPTPKPRPRPIPKPRPRPTPRSVKNIKNSNKPSKKSVNIKPKSNKNSNKKSPFDKHKSEFQKLGDKMSKQRSDKTEKMFKDNKNLWHFYHDKRDKSFKGYNKQNEIPINKIIIYLETKSKHKLEILDLGCGRNKIKEHFKSNSKFNITGYDFVSYNGSIECDISMLPNENESIDMCIFSQSLMGSNWKSYLQEAKRVLKYNGEMIISESVERHQIIKDFIEELGCHIKHDDFKPSKRWFYIHALKN